MNTEQTIKENAHRLFLQLGLKEVSMDDIAHECGISKKTLYIHFASKEQLVSEVFSDLLQKYQTQIEASYQKGENAIDAWWKSQPAVSDMLVKGNPLLGRQLQRGFPAVWKNVQNFQTRFLLPGIIEHLQRGIDEKLFRKDLNLNVIGLMRLQQMEAVANDDFAGNGLQRDEVFKQLSLYYLYGITNTKGRQIIEQLTENSIQHENE